MQFQFFFKYKGEISGDEMHMCVCVEYGRPVVSALCVSAHIHMSMYLQAFLLQIEERCEERVRDEDCVGVYVGGGGHSAALCWISLNIHLLMCSYCAFKSLPAPCRIVEKTTNTSLGPRLLG